MTKQTAAVAVFVGQGAQFTGMAAPFLRHGGFKRAVVECAAAYEAAVGKGRFVQDLREAIKTCDGIDDTRIAQPLLAALEVGVSAVVAAGPEVTVGHSLGELPAAYAAGVLTLGEVMGIVHHRSAMLEKAKGAMAVVRQRPAAALLTLKAAGLDAVVSVAASNGAASATVAGSTPAVAEAVKAFKTERVVARSLPVKYAFHSPLITEDDVQGLAETLAAHVFSSSPTTVAAGTGTFLPAGLLTQDELCSEADPLPLYETRLASFSPRDPVYWARQCRNPVAFDTAMQRAARILSGNTAATALEIGPKPVLSSFIEPFFKVDEWKHHFPASSA